VLGIYDPIAWVAAVVLAELAAGRTAVDRDASRRFIPP
jgi:hypothetical protein